MSYPICWRLVHAQARTVTAVDSLDGDTLLLRRLYVLLFIEHGARRIHLARDAAELVQHRRLHRDSWPK
jgi:hypothetical protein